MADGALGVLCIECTWKKWVFASLTSCFSVSMNVYTCTYVGSHRAAGVDGNGFGVRGG